MSQSGYAEPMVTWMIHSVRLLIVLTSRHRALALEPGAATTAGSLSADPAEAHHALARSPVLDRAAGRVGALEIVLGGHRPRHSCRPASSRLFVVLGPPVETSRGSAPSRTGCSTTGSGDGPREPTSMRTAVVKSAQVFQYSMASLPTVEQAPPNESPRMGGPTMRPVNADHCPTRDGRLSNPELAAASSCRVDCPATYFYPCRLRGRSPHLVCALRASSSL